jgi:hypothetical protein
MSVGRTYISTKPSSFFDNFSVTELLGTDLHRLLTSRPLEKQFIQYFLYQILVSYTSPTPTRALLTSTAWSEICPLRRCCPP